MLEATARIIEEAGVEALSARKVASEIGYTVGTIYQHFSNMDDLVEQTNAETLEELYDVCSGVPENLDTHDRLRKLANSFVSFAHDNRARWDAVISYKYAPGHKWSEHYDSKFEKLLALILTATKSLYTDGEDARHWQDVRTLWSAMYGIFTLASARRLGTDQTLETAIEGLIDLYLAARK